MDAQTDARPQLLGRRPTAVGAHSPLENRLPDTGFPQRQQAAAPGMLRLRSRLRAPDYPWVAARWGYSMNTDVDSLWLALFEPLR